MTESKFPLIEGIGLFIRQRPHRDFANSPEYLQDMVLASDLEMILSEGVRVNGVVGVEYSTWHSAPQGTFIQENYNHQALLIAIKPISRKVTKAEIVEALRSNACEREAFINLGNLANRIETEGIE